MKSIALEISDTYLHLQWGKKRCLLQAMVRGAFRETLGELDTREYRDLRKPKAN